MADIFELAEQGKIKRIFRVREKISYPGAVCHITQRASGKEPLFLEESDYLYMLYLLKNNVRKFEYDLFSYILMPNHLHVLIRLAKDNLSKAMKHLYGPYAIYFNKKYERKGHVFGGAFRQALCLSDNYLLSASLYIHLNAVRANLVNDPEKYQRSSCGLYVTAFKGKTFVNHSFIPKLLDNNILVGKKLYRQILNHCMAVEAEEVWENPHALENFKRKIVKHIPKLAYVNENIKKEYFNELELEEKIVDLKKRQRLRSPETVKARRFLIEQLRARGYSIKAIAEILHTTRQTIHRALMLHN